MQNFAKTFVRRAAGPVAAAATGVTTAQARAVPNVVPNVYDRPGPKFEDEWVLTHVNGGQVLFQPYSGEEIDERVDEIASMIFKPTKGHSVVISEVAMAEGSDCTDGSSADCVIEAAEARRHGHRSACGQDHQLSALLQLTSKMLRSPGLQCEVVKCMVEDPEVRQLMLAQCDDLDVYLAAAGIPTAPGGLLLPGDGVTSEGTADGADRPKDVVGSLINAVSSLLQNTGGALAVLGGWLRDRFTSLLAPRVDEPEGGKEGPAGGSRGGVKKSTDVVLGSVMVAAVAVFCILFAKRPTRLRFA